MVHGNGRPETSTIPPLILLHGGPGAGHNYFVPPFTEFHKQYRVPIVFYDQISCGKSTHLQEKNGDTEFRNLDLFVNELGNLVRHLGLDDDRGFSIFGQSWGGMLGAAYSITRPKGPKRLVMGSGPASIPLYKEGVKTLLKGLPLDVQRTLEECEEKGDTSSKEYKASSLVWIKKHVLRLDRFPQAILDTIENTKTDPTVYGTMCGLSEFQIIGTIKDMDFIQDARKIDIPVLLLNGRHDETTDLCFKPWFEEIPKVRWVQLENASHMGFYEEKERYLELVGDFVWQYQAGLKVNGVDYPANLSL